jgi:hypothetical protein
MKKLKQCIITFGIAWRIIHKTALAMEAQDKAIEKAFANVYNIWDDYALDYYRCCWKIPKRFYTEL